MVTEFEYNDNLILITVIITGTLNSFMHIKGFGRKFIEKILLDNGKTQIDEYFR